MSALKDNSGLVSAEVKQRMGSLYQSMARRLAIRQPPKIVFREDAENAKKPFGMTGYYDPTTRMIRVFITGRHPTDILRTFAHELIHHWQNERGTLVPSTTGQEHYAQKDPVLRQREKEAYLLGNILFRDWQDECRYGSFNETIKKSEIKKLIKERLSLFLESEPKYDKSTFARMQKKYFSRNSDAISGKNYYSVGFSNPAKAICWIWDSAKKKLDVKIGTGHGDLFPKGIPYQTFRGRYDDKTHKLSLTVPDGTFKWSGDINKDVPKELLQALKTKFNNPEILYFPNYV